MPGTPRDLLAEVTSFASRCASESTSADYFEKVAQALLLSSDVIDRPWSELSGGECHRAALALALSAQPPPEVLLLDEPTAACDSDTTAAIEDYLLNDGKAIVWITHDEAQARRIAHRLVVFGTR